MNALLVTDAESRLTVGVERRDDKPLARHRGRGAKRHQLQWWDALILEAALRAQADVLVTEDGQYGQRFGKLTVENPFV